jgi:hypothetical protein
MRKIGRKIHEVFYIFVKIICVSSCFSWCVFVQFERYFAKVRKGDKEIRKVFLSFVFVSLSATSCFFLAQLREIRKIFREDSQKRQRDSQSFFLSFPFVSLSATSYFFLVCLREIRKIFREDSQSIMLNSFYKQIIQLNYNKRLI